MIGPFVARVAFRNCRNCLISVPKNFLPPNVTDQIVVFHLYVDDGRSSYFSWSGEVTSSSAASRSDSVVEINGLYALKLGLHEEQEVLVTQVPNAVSLERISLEPVAVDDWEILELHADYVQNNLLNQVRIVWNGQTLPVWVEPNVCIFTIITNLVPECVTGRLEQMTEVHVSPKSRNISSAPSRTDARRSTINSRRSSRRKETIVSEEVHDKCSVEAPPSDGWWPASVALLRHLKDKWILGKHDSNGTGSLEQKPEYFSDSHLLEVIDFDVKLRVHASDRLREVFAECPSVNPFDTRRLSVQPYTVFVMSSSLPIEIGRPLVIARMSKVIPSYDSSEKGGQRGKSTLKLPQVGSSASLLKSNKMSSVVSQQSKRPTNETRTEVCYVKVVVVDVLLSHMDSQCKAIEQVASRVMDLMAPGAVYVPASVQEELGCEVTSRVALQFGTHALQRPDSITFSTVKRKVPGASTVSLQLEVCQWLSTVCSIQCPLVVTSGSTLQVVNVEHGVMEDFVVRGDNDGMALLINPSVKVDFQWDGIKNHPLPILVEVPIIGLKSAAVGGMDDLIHRGLTFLSVNLGLGPLSEHLKQHVKGTTSGCSGGLLICGARGSGKTTLAQTLCRELTDSIYRVHCTYVACKSLKGKRVESVFRVWTRSFQEATYRAPSVVLLDDLDHLLGTSTGPESETSAGYHQRMSTAFLEILKAVRMSRNSSVVVLATCLTATSLHPSLASSQGVHVFQDILDIKSPTMDQRNAVLRRLLLSKTIISCRSIDSVEEDLRPVLTRTEGFVALDLNMLLDRAVHVASRKANAESRKLVLTVEDLETALVNFVPASIRALQSPTSRVSKGWKDVGGLRAVKQALIETLEWPAKYPEIFSRCPLPMRSGVLLYGPPGTGKTLLASVIAKECNMNFISIKGPELLSKYIGASEQSVRDLFQRAASAKPCVVFFDEFDSLASKRGHDSTGVTDRVVNQLLTQMDGVEGRQGVYILAATSRPDLIDPALLRPGRFDRCLCCPMPSQEERVEILSALTSSLNMSPNIDIVEMAARCDHFSGADLQGLLCNAQLKAIHRSSQAYDVKLSFNSSFDEVCCVSDDDEELTSCTIFLPSLEEGISPLSEKVEEQVDVILSNSGYSQRRGRRGLRKGESTSASYTIGNALTVDDLLEALADMKPSVSGRERQRYETIYDTFTKSRCGHFGGESEVVGSKRATLA